MAFLTALPTAGTKPVQVPQAIQSRRGVLVHASVHTAPVTFRVAVYDSKNDVWIWHANGVCLHDPTVGLDSLDYSPRQDRFVCTDEDAYYVLVVIIGSPANVTFADVYRANYVSSGP